MRFPAASVSGICKEDTSMKRILSLVLALVMVLGCVPAYAAAKLPAQVVGNMSELTGVPAEPVAPEYTLETVDGHYVLTIADGEKYAQNGGIYADSRNDEWDWSSVFFEWDEDKKAFVSNGLLDTENYPEDPTLYFNQSADSTWTSVQLDFNTGAPLFSYINYEDENGDYEYSYNWNQAYDEFYYDNDEGIVFYDTTDGSLINYRVYTEDYEISYDPYGRISWVSAAVETDDGIMYLDWDEYLQAWTTWDPEAQEYVAAETDLPDFDASKHPALIALPYEVKLADATIDVTSDDVWKQTDENGTVIGYIMSGENCTCYYDLNGNMTSYFYNDLDTTMGVEYDLNGTLLYAWADTADGQTYYYFDASEPLKLADGTTVSGWYYWDENGEIVTCDKPAGVDLAPALTKPAVAKDVIWYPENTMCVAGISLKDTYGITDKWYNVVPVDLTKDGTQAFDLVASGMFLIGKANVTVADGNVTVTYGMPWGHGYIKEEVLNWFTSVDQITAEFCDAPTSAYAFGEPVSISEDLGGADVGLLFICNRVTYRQPYYNNGAHLVRWYCNKPEWKAFREQLMTIMPE